MIEKINEITDFDDWKIRDIYSVRILSLLQSYGTKYNFAVFYRQIIDGKVTAIMSRLDNDFTLAICDDTDDSELIHFFCISGFSTITCSSLFDFGAKYEEGVVMASDTKRDTTMQGAVLDEYPKLMDLFNFVDYQNQDFKSWYVDISHRVRHGTAKAYTLNVNDTIISSGILSSIIDGYSILTGVRTDDEFRGMGYGSCLVDNICSDINGTVYIMRDKNLNEHFYNSLGFENIGKWRIYK